MGGASTTEPHRGARLGAATTSHAAPSSPANKGARPTGNARRDAAGVAPGLGVRVGASGQAPPRLSARPPNAMGFSRGTPGWAPGAARCPPRWPVGCKSLFGGTVSGRRSTALTPRDNLFPARRAPAATSRAPEARAAARVRAPSRGGREGELLRRVQEVACTRARPAAAARARVTADSGDAGPSRGTAASSASCW
jgi:hypothetical protein